MPAGVWTEFTDARIAAGIDYGAPTTGNEVIWDDVLHNVNILRAKLVELEEEETSDDDDVKVIEVEIEVVEDPEAIIRLIRRWCS